MKHVGGEMRGDPAKVTIYTVAERAGVSISTVSLALNAPHRVAEQTRSRIIETAALLGYRTARERGTTESGALRVVVAAPFSSYPSYYRRLNGMLTHAGRANVELLVHDLGSAASAQAPLLDALPIRRGVDGVIVMGVPPGGAALRAGKNARLPIVLVDVRRANTQLDDLPTILVDDEKGGQIAGQHLAEKGHRTAIFLHEKQRSNDYLSAGMLRAEGAARHITLIPVGVDTLHTLGSTIRDALHAHPDTTAIFANHDLIAGAAFRELAALGRRIPQDTSVIGYDDGDIAEMLGLTTIRQPFEASGRVALEVLLESLGGTDTRGNRHLLTPELVTRTSS